MDFSAIRDALRKPTTRICGVPALVALNLVFFMDQWFKSVAGTTRRFVSSAIKTDPRNGTDNIVVAKSREMRDGFVSFTAGVVQALGDRVTSLTLDDILASEELLSAFLFSVSGNVGPLKVFAAWFNSLSDEDKAKLTGSANAVKAACAHVAWLKDTCQYFLSDANFDPVVKLCSVEYHGDIPSFDELISGEPAAYLKNYIKLYESGEKTADVAALLAVDLNKFTVFTQFLLENPEVSL